MRGKKRRTHRRIGISKEALVGEAHEQRRFPDGGIASDDEFEYIVPGRARHRVSSFESWIRGVTQVVYKVYKWVQGFRVGPSIQAAYKAGLTPQLESKSSKVRQMEDKLVKATGVTDKSTKPK
jgi:hypothetical protein